MQFCQLPVCSQHCVVPTNIQYYGRRSGLRSPCQQLHLSLTPCSSPLLYITSVHAHVRCSTYSLRLASPVFTPVHAKKCALYSLSRALAASLPTLHVSSCQYALGLLPCCMFALYCQVLYQAPQFFKSFSQRSVQLRFAGAFHITPQVTSTHPH